MTSLFLVVETVIFEFSVLDLGSVPIFSVIRRLGILGHFGGWCPFSRGRGSLSVGRLVDFLLSDIFELGYCDFSIYRFILPISMLFCTEGCVYGQSVMVG